LSHQRFRNRRIAFPTILTFLQLFSGVLWKIRDAEAGSARGGVSGPSLRLFKAREQTNLETQLTDYAVSIDAHHDERNTERDGLAGRDKKGDGGEAGDLQEAIAAGEGELIAFGRQTVEAIAFGGDAGV
jgi:hypothetical protein